jgi:hypothetical protein
MFVSFSFFPVMTWKKLVHDVNRYPHCSQYNLYVCFLYVHKTTVVLSDDFERHESILYSNHSVEIKPKEKQISLASQYAPPIPVILSCILSSSPSFPLLADHHRISHFPTSFLCFLFDSPCFPLHSSLTEKHPPPLPPGPSRPPQA